MPADPEKPNGDLDDFARDLELAANGDLDARNRMWTAHYELLRGCAKDWFDNNWRRRGAGHAISLCGTEIVNVAYQRLRDRTATLQKGRAWFFRCFYTECMRIAVDHYRKTRNDKGRGEHGRVDLESNFLRDQRVDASTEAIYEVLDELSQKDARAGQVAMLKVFENVPDERQPGAMRGLTNGEVAELLGYGLRTVEKDWAFAKGYLLSRIAGD